ncbi:beta strand repeat-containing protein, partial [Flavobacterium succinicans]|uniref:beta strand repeat-containing protein n=2 Tax=Flavobacterium succinicans TaxID=29536 RepID=UPI001114286F
MFSQVCGTPGADGPILISSSINTYFPIATNISLAAGQNSVNLGAVPPTDSYGNSFGTLQINSGDLLLIIQMQDASINATDNNRYGSGELNSGPDLLGGTGFTSIGNTGLYEYVVASNNVPLTGGNLTFVGTGAGNGLLNSYVNAAATTTSGKKTFQIVRVPQYSNLTLTANVTTPPFNGVCGGVIAFNVSGTFNFNGFTIDGNARGFRGGYSPQAGSGSNNGSAYVGLSSNTVISGKGEGIAGTPRFMWDGFNQVDNIIEGMPNGSAGRGAPANAGGGGNDHNAGGGGGGNGGNGGLGGRGWQGNGGDINPLTGGGRPGFKSFLTATPDMNRLIMGGGGGAGDANNATSGVKGGVGGAIVIINAGTIQGNGSIFANGGNGAPGTYANAPDGAGGGGAGGSVFLNISNSSTATIIIQARGGNGGNTENDNNNSHGPGGGGGGGIVRHNLVGAVTISANVSKGVSGRTNAGAGITHGAIDGEDGYLSYYVAATDLPPNLNLNNLCLPNLETKVTSLFSTVCNQVNGTFSYAVEIKNTGSGNAGNVQLDFKFPVGIEYDTATSIYSLGAAGPAGALINTGTANNPIVGGYNIPKDGYVTITITGRIVGAISNGTYSVDAQALYLDPTRTASGPTRRITPLVNAFNSANTSYQTGGSGNVLGFNFSGAATNVDDVSFILAPTLVLSNGNQSQTVCTGTAISSTVYTWGGSATDVTVASLPTGLTATKNAAAKTVTITGIPSATGTYSVNTIGQTAPCTAISLGGTITVNPLPSIYSVTGGGAYCSGGGGVAVGLANSQSGINYQLQIGGVNDGAAVAGTGSAISFGNKTAVGIYTVVATNATTGCNTSMTGSGVVSINSLPAAPTAPMNVTVCETGSSQTLTATATVPSGSSIVWYDAAIGGNVVNPPTLVSTTAATRTLYGQTSNGTCSSSNRTAVTLTILAAPGTQFATTSDITVACGALTTSTLSYSNNSTTCPISGSVTSTLSAIPSTCGGPVTESWTFTDQLGRTISKTRTITVSPAALPTMTAPADITVACGALPAPSTLSFSNGLTGGCEISGTSNASTFSTTPNSCGGTVTETWTATDTCGRALASVSRTITVSPAALSTMTAPADITVACGALPAPSTISYSNGLTGGCEISGTSNASTFSTTPNSCGGTVTETWTATDTCGRALASV